MQLNGHAKRYRNHRNHRYHRTGRDWPGGGAGPLGWSLTEVLLIAISSVGRLSVAGKLITSINLSIYPGNYISRV